EGFEEHAAVADGLAVGLAGDLLGGGAGADQAVEPGAGAAGDGDEEEGEEQAGAAGGHPPLPGGLLDGEAAEEDADDADGQGQVEDESAQVAAGLKERPDGGEGCDEAVGDDEQGPGLAVEDEDRREA